MVGSRSKTGRIGAREAPTPQAERSIEAGLTASEAEDLRHRLAASEDERLLLRALIDTLPNLLFVKDLEGRFVVANRATAADFGRASADELIGKTDLDFYPADVGARHFRHEQEILASGQASVDREALSFDASRGEKWLSVTKVPLRDARNAIIGLAGTCQDITERKRAEALRLGQAELLEMVVRGASLERVLDRLARLVDAQLHGVVSSILLMDPDGVRLRRGAAPGLPEAFSTLVDGLPVGPKAGSCGTAAFRREAVIVSDVRQDPLWEEFRDVAATFGIRSCWSTPVISHKGAVLGTFALYSGAVHLPTPAERRLVDLGTYIAGIAIERARAEDRITFLAHHDALTGLPNRTLLVDRLTQAIAAAARRDRWVTAVFLDLDNFKLVNDSLGHNAGDELLRVVAQRMTACLRKSDTVVRLGGDEFVILLADLPKDFTGITEIVHKVQTTLSAPVELGADTIQVTCSIGLATYPADGRTAEALLANADVAMYRAKDNGRDAFQFYTADMNRTVHERLALQEDLRAALQRAEFRLAYQPQVDLRSGRIFGAEALIRWRHPTRGDLPPATFIPVAEDCGLIVPIGRWVLGEACRQARAWKDAGLPPVTVCVNVSAGQFRAGSFLREVTDMLGHCGLEGRDLELELTETMVMRDSHKAAAVMEGIAALGVRLSIDDFGTGYSSLGVLKRFPFTRLKIDHSFIDGVPDDANDRAIAAAVISMAHELQIEVIAEGVETDRQVAFLKANGCDAVQGFRFGRPASPEAFEALLRAGAGTVDLTGGLDADGA